MILKPMRSRELNKLQTPSSLALSASGLTITPKETHETFFLVNLACDKLRELASSKDSRPFSLRVDFWGPHFPYFPTQEFADMYTPKISPNTATLARTSSTNPPSYSVGWPRIINKAVLPKSVVDLAASPSSTDVTTIA